MEDRDYRDCVDVVCGPCANDPYRSTPIKRTVLFSPTVRR